MKQIFNYISADSRKNAVKVLEEIVLAVNKATANPEFIILINTNITTTEVFGLLNTSLQNSLPL